MFKTFKSIKYEPARSMEYWSEKTTIVSTIIEDKRKTSFGRWGLIVKKWVADTAIEHIDKWSVTQYCQNKEVSYTF